MSTQKLDRRTKVGLFSVRNQLMVAIAAVVIVLSAAALIVSLALQQNRIEKDLASRLSTLSEAEADSIQTILSSQISLLRNLSDSATTGDAAIASAASLPENPEELQQILQTRDAEWQAADDTATLIRSILNNRGSRELNNFVENVPGHTEVMVTDINGALASASNRPTDYVQADEAWWQAAWNNGEGAIYIANEFSFDDSVGANILIMALPLERNGEIVGVLRSSFRADAIQAILSTAFRAGDTGRVMIVNGAGLILASSDTALANQTIPSFATLFTIEQTETNQLAEINTMSNASLIGSTHRLSTDGQTAAIDNLNWYLLLALDQSEAYEPIQQTLIATGLISIAVLIASLVLAYYLSRVLTRPLEALTAATQDIAVNRNWRARVEVPGHNEFGLLGRTFNAMAAQIQETLTTLEDRVSARTRDMVIAADVAQKISSTLDLNDLLQSVSDLTKERFDLYHAHIYLLDDAGKNLVLMAGAGEVGRTMTKEGRSIPTNHLHSIVASAVRTKRGVIVDDVTKIPDFLANPLLPDTKSEMAIPIIVGDSVIGVLDVQANRIKAFDNEDVRVQTTLAGQIAIAAQNAGAFKRVTDAQTGLKLYADLIQNVPIGIYVWKLEDINDPYSLRLVAANPASQIAAGGTVVEEVIGKKMIDIFPEAFETQIPQIYGHVVRTGETVDLGENRFEGADGSITIIALKAFPLPDNSVGVSFENVTERKVQEETIQRRAIEMETVAQVSASATKIMDVDELLQSVVDVTKESFGLYHTHIYLLDETNYDLVLAAGAGNPGRQMKAKGHKIPLSREHSLVVRAATSLEAQIVNDVSTNLDFLPNPMLPDTRSEMAIPITIGTHLIGVLDIQANITNRFTNDDVRVKTALANQIAVAIQNARSFQQTELRLHDLQASQQIADTIREGGALETLIENTMKIIVKTFGGDNAVYSVYDYTRNVWQGVAGAGEGMTSAIAQNFSDPGPAYPHGMEVLRTGRTVAINNTHAYPDFPEAYIELLGLKSVLTLPVFTGNNVTGAIFINFNTQQHTFREEEISLANTIANQVSTGIERTQAEEESGRNLKLLRTVIDATPDWIFAKDRDYRYILVNKGYADAMGNISDEMLGKDDLELGFPEELVLGNAEKNIRGFRTDDIAVIETGGSLHNPYDPATFVDGSVHVFDTQKLPLRDSDGEIFGILGFARDVTERIQVEEDRNRLYSTSIDMLGSAGFDGYFKDLNPAWSQTLGWSIEELMAKPYIEFVHPEDVEPTNRESNEQLAAGLKTLSFENRYVCKDGSYRWLSWNATPDITTGLIYFVTRDVTQQKQTEEERNRLYSSSIDLLGSAGFDGYFKDLNPAWSQTLGWSIEELMTKPYIEFVHPDDIEPTNREANEQLAAGFKTLSFENRYLAKDGAYRWLSWNSTPDVTSGLIYFVVRDVTDQKQTEEERKQQEEIIRRRANDMETVARVGAATTSIIDVDELLQNASDLTKERFNLYHAHIYLLDEAGENLVLAAGAGEIGKHMVSEGRTIPFDHPHSLVASAARTHQAIIVNDVAKAPDFLPNPLLLRTRSEMALPMIVGNELIGVLDVQSDRVDRFDDEDVSVKTTLASQIAIAVQNARSFQQTQVALQQTERRALEMETVARVGAATTSIIDVDELLQSVVDVTKDSFNLYHAHIYLLDEESYDMVLAAGAGEPGRIMKENHHKIPLARQNSLVVLAATTLESQIVNDVSINPDFLANPLLPDTKSEMAIPMIVGTRLIGVLDVQGNTINRFDEEDVRVKTALANQIAVAVENARSFQDAALRAETEREIAEQLREVDRLKSQFLANMSHELRTPLNSIIGYSEVLLDGVDGDLTDDAQEDVSAIHNSGKHLLSLINEILDLAKIEAGEMRLDYKPQDITEIVRDIMRTGQMLIKDKPVSLELEVKGDIPNVRADLIRLRQIILNLVSNATKFTERGTVKITVEALDDSIVRVAVTDSGIGIRADKVHLVFERFSQVDGSSTRRAGGTGLGLTITKQLVEMHGGEIDVESVYGEGSTFWFTLPVFVPVQA